MVSRDEAVRRFWRFLNERKLIRAMAAHSPLSAFLAHEAGFDALWASGFELSALVRLADVSSSAWPIIWRWCER